MLARELRNRYRRWRLKRHPLPEELWREALGYSRYAAALPPPLQAQLREQVILFLLDKRFEGAAGFVPDERVRVTVAVKACLPILHLGLDYYDGWHGIVVYPGDFRVQEEYMDEYGVVHRAPRELCGEAIGQGPLVLSWQTIEDERHALDRDVVIHECAHKLDAINGATDGLPPLPAVLPTRRWGETFSAAFAALSEAVERQESTRLDPYAATDPAEFYAVASETFFTAPALLHEEFPVVYDALRTLYRQDPRRVLEPIT